MTFPIDETALEAPLSRRKFLKWSALAGAGALASSSFIGRALGRGTPAARPSTGVLATSAAMFSLAEKPFDHLKAGLEGFSAAQLEQHLGLYRNYVAQVAKSAARLDELQAAAQWDAMRDVFLKQSYAINGALLHDWYFSALGGSQRAPGPLASERITRDFGDFARFEASLKAAGAAMRGWVVTGVSLSDGKLRHYGMDAHDVGVPLGVFPILALDVYEHAYMIDFGTRRASYLDAFWRNLDWAVIESRLRAAAAQR
ncbi:MAG: twin-arginine translocation signal domain-containing protein [Vampirovibrionales bacterium]|nr:twin-arginine translocation signal domain-containing protein [Vampirovibrionales bacterium]